MKKLSPKEILAFHRKIGGKIETVPKYAVKNRADLTLIYTPGVGVVSSHLAKHKSDAKYYTIKKNAVAVISDGSAVLGLGNIGPEGALPVMEGKAVIFKTFAGIDAYPIVLSTQNPAEIVAAVKAIAPTFGAINLEDIAAPNCFEIEERLRAELDIPVLHDDQWGTAVVVLAGLINALKVTGKKMGRIKIVISGAGAAGTAVIKILKEYGAKNILVLDRAGIIYKARSGNAPDKEALAEITNPRNIQGSLEDALQGADLFVGLSSAGIVTVEMVKTMAAKAIVFALANPTPEIMPDEAKRAGAYIAASGRSDFPNQLNNALSYPGIFRGALDRNVKAFTMAMLIRAAENLAGLVQYPTPEKIIPSIFDKGVVEAVSKAIR
ncbi:MAG: malate dehydrogenase [Candidatus Colwellbacteria bacterium RIFCSPLOWO2_01_FULL_48_10]|uniref:Malate dehydrogenase n=1 Tax=Candidatus Colwellbacteria bacterium RIFCSPLOWO2_01_FULL_48_10 TaxID=1797690 RepID=A0A1G1Z4W3_9BACT|nr:MAG: malate dehydrogenase [Candidatus Colwellbacteria bacterium RIFCSPLOWO2_01_FULL_48_10]